MPSEQLVWLITGCSSGIGRELTLAALTRGDKVIATSRAGSFASIADLKDTGAAVLPLDVTAPSAEINEVAADVVKIYGHVDVVMNNAGASCYLLGGALEEVSHDDLVAQFNTNVFGAMNVSRAFLPYMRERRKGTIAFIGSVYGWTAAPFAGAYVANKFAVRGTDGLGTCRNCLWINCPMAHNRGDSLDSTASLSSLTFVSSLSSIETYGSLKDDIAEVEHSQADLQELVREAEKIIKEKFAPDPRHTYTYRKDTDKISVNLDEVNRAMLANAEECGGEDAKRYVASAIVACSRREDVVETLAALGVTWLTHFLFMFKASRSHKFRPDEEPHELATPTLQTTVSHVGEGVGHRIGSFSDDLMMRDGYQCILTGFQDRLHPSPDESVPSVYLKVCHILRRAIGQIDKDPKSPSFMSAITTFDILANYARFPKEIFEDLQDHLDDPSNGMILQSDAHNAYDDFNWCLKATGKENVYTVKVFNNMGILRRPPDDLVTFRDQSNDFTHSGSSHKRNRDIPLPNPQYLAIHAAITEILHMSAAGKFFDKLLDKYKDDEGNVPPVRSWLELERVMDEDVLRESVRSLQLAGVH